MIDRKMFLVKIALSIASLFFVAMAFFSQFDIKAQRQIDQSFNQALGVFATAKALNGVISLVQGTEVGPPGVTLTVGEILDPINDLVERFSWVMLASLASLGIQQIGLNIIEYPLFDWIFAGLLLSANTYMWLVKEKSSNTKRFMIHFMAVMVFIRFSLPLMLLVTTFVNEEFVQKSYNVAHSQKVLQDSKKSVAALNEEEYSLFSSDFYTKKLDQITRSLENVSDNIIHLLIVFFFQTIFFPILFLYLSYKFISHLFNLKE